MQNDIAISIRNVTKMFKVYRDKSNSIRDKIIHRSGKNYKEKYVLQGVSFDIKKGEAVGLIGRNGCGKSTLLKLINRIIIPTSGEIVTKGRIASLIELGAGFHPDLTGRENIYINSSVFGLSSNDVDRRIDEIIRFSELEDYIDNPVRTYSSGMYMRLAFAVAINVDADILLIDEILAVGDMAFQTKCYNKIQEIKHSGTTIVIVSHSSDQIERICDYVVWLEKGKIKKQGNTHLVQQEYIDFIEKESEERRKKEYEEKRKNALQSGVKTDDLSCFEICDQSYEEARRKGNGKVRVTKLEILDKNGNKKTSFEYEDEIKVHIVYDTNETVNGYFQVDFLNQDWQFVHGTNTKNNIITFDGVGEANLIIRKNHFANKSYYLYVSIFSEDGMVLDSLSNIVLLKNKASQKYGYGMCCMEDIWEIMN